MAKRASEAQNQGAFYLVNQPIPRPESDDLLVKVIAIGMNPVDTKIRKRPGEDTVPGWDVYGEIESTGKKSSGISKRREGLTPENFRIMHTRQESGKMMGKQGLIL